MLLLAYLMPIAVLLIILGKLLVPRRSIELSHLRGALLRSENQVATILQTARGKGDPGIAVGKHRFPSEVANEHIAFVGATGSGKTVMQRLLMQSTLPLIGNGQNHRALIYDAKRDLLSLLGGMKLKCPIHLLNPMDSRGVAWDAAADITTAPAAHQLARILIPAHENDQNRFFPDAARSLLEATFLFLIRKHPGKWTLRHALLLVRSPNLLEQVVAAYPDTHDLLNLFEYKPTLQNIMAAVVTYLRPYQLIAAAWEHAPKTISLTQWAESESILILGNDEGNRAAVDTLHRVIFFRLAETILSRSEGDGGQTWFFLDEVREAQRLDKLSQLLTQGRSKGARVVLGFQDIEGLRHVYKDKVGNELVGQCATKVILRLNSPETASWASKVLGKEEVMESRRGTSRQFAPSLSQTVGQSTSHGITQRPLVLESEITELPKTSFASGLTCFIRHPLTGSFKSEITGKFLRESLLSPDPSISDLKPVPSKNWFLSPLSPSELKFLMKKPPLLEVPQAFPSPGLSQAIGDARSHQYRSEEYDHT